MSEWERDEQGKYFRWVGGDPLQGKKGIKEYRPTIQTSYGTIYQDEAEAIGQRNRERQAKQFAEMRAKQEAIQTGKHCPFKRGRGSLHCSCERSCAFYQGDGCVFSGDQVVPTERGKFCPLADRCEGDLCSLFRDGCSLSGIRKGEPDE